MEKVLFKEKYEKLMTFNNLGVHESSGPQTFCHQGPVSERQFFHGLGPWFGWRDGSGGNASDGEQQVMLRSLTLCSPPAVRLGS